MVEFIDNFCKKCVQKHLSYIKDTHEFLSKLRTAKVLPFACQEVLRKNQRIFLDITVLKWPQTNETGILNTKVFFKPTDAHQFLSKSSFRPKHIFARILKFQITWFHSIYSQIMGFGTACTIELKALRKHLYCKRFLRAIKSETWANLKTCNSLNPPFHYVPNIDALSTQCERPYCPPIEYFGPYLEIVSTAT